MRVVDAPTLVFYLRVERLSVDCEKKSKLSRTVWACTSERSDAALTLVSTWSAVSRTAVVLFSKNVIAVVATFETKCIISFELVVRRCQCGTNLQWPAVTV